MNAKDGDGRRALQLAIKASADSYWTNRCTPDSIRALPGASAEGIERPTGSEEADALLAV